MVKQILKDRVAKVGVAVGVVGLVSFASVSTYYNGESLIYYEKEPLATWSSLSQQKRGLEEELRVLSSGSIRSFKALEDLIPEYNQLKQRYGSIKSRQEEVESTQKYRDLREEQAIPRELAGDFMWASMGSSLLAVFSAVYLSTKKSKHLKQP